MYSVEALSFLNMDLELTIYLQFWIAVFATIFSYSSIVSSVQNVRVEGSEFINNVTSSRFQILGIAYQPGGAEAYGISDSDPLSNGTLCLRDAALMQSLVSSLGTVFSLCGTTQLGENIFGGKFLAI